MATNHKGVTGYGTTIHPDNGRPLMFRESQYAARNFKIHSGKSNDFISSIVPKPKFLFFVNFVISSTAIEAVNGGDTRRMSDVEQGIVFQIKQIDKPKFNIKTETMHQYNKKRIVQTGLDYNPMTINFHDDVGDRVLKFWADYYKFHYGDGGRTESSEWMNDIVKRDFVEGHGWGLKGNYGGNADNMHYLTAIELYQFYGSYFTKISFVNPLITIFDHDNNDYAEGREGTGIRISFDYEGVIYELDSKDIRNHPELLTKFNFLSDYFSPDSADPFENDPAPSTASDKRNSTVDAASGINKLIGSRSKGHDRLQDKVVADQAKTSNASAKIIGGGRSFGSIPGLDSNNLTKLSSSVGGNPSVDILEKETGVKNTINNFGSPTVLDVGSILTTSSKPRNSGIDSLKVDQAAAILNPEKTVTEQVVGVGQTKIVSQSSSTGFSRSMGTAAALAANEGLVDGVASFPAVITQDSIDDRTMVNKMPSGKYQLTNVGATVLNVLRAPTSAVGVRGVTSDWNNLNPVDSAKRLLAAESGDSSLIDV